MPEAPGPDDQRLRTLLAQLKHVAVVGLSPQPDRPSHDVALYLQRRGLHVLPVNPAVSGEVLGEICYRTVADLPLVPDVVVVFRRPVDVPPVLDATLRRGAGGFWLQLGIRNPEMEAQAAAAGMWVVADRCIKLEFQRLLPLPGSAAPPADPREGDEPPAPGCPGPVGLARPLPPRLPGATPEDRT